MEQINESLTPTAPPGGPDFSVTTAALTRIRYLLSDEPHGTRFWIGVLGGGCSGFQYNFDLKAQQPADSDTLIEGIVAVDEVSMGLLKGSALDYEEDLASAGFVVKNPNATAKCGCGNSFSVAF